MGLLLLFATMLMLTYWFGCIVLVSNQTDIFFILLNVQIITDVCNPCEPNPAVSLTLCFLLVAVIKKVEVTKKSENQSRSPSRKSVLKGSVRHPRATQHHICAKRKPTGDHTITGGDVAGKYTGKLLLNNFYLFCFNVWWLDFFSMFALVSPISASFPLPLCVIFVAREL